MKVLLFALLLAASPAAAESVADLLMKPGILAQIPADDLPSYAHTRQVPDQPSGQSGQAIAPLQSVSDGQVSLSRVVGEGGEDKLTLSLTEGGESRVVAEFPPATSNPVLLFFLENVVRSVAAGTGGSPYYIRNRIRDAMVSAQAGDENPAEIVLHPFADDPNAARLGNFAQLTITLRYDPSRPDRLFELLADTAQGSGGYSETMTLIGER